MAIKDAENTKQPVKEKAGVVEFRKVSFAYPDAEEKVLSDITFTADQGKTTAIIGSTGSGKSTLVNLIPRFFDVCEGEILVDGVDVRQLSQKELRERIGYVPQKGVLFSGTIASNLRYGREEASDDEIRKAAKIAQALDFIEEKEDKFDSPIAQGIPNHSPSHYHSPCPRPVLLFGETPLWKRSSMVSLLAVSNKSLFLSTFVLTVSLVSTPSKR